MTSPDPQYTRGFEDGFEAGRKSKILMISTGEYSDYSVHGSFDIMKSFTFNEVIAAFRAQRSDANDDYDNRHEFIGWLVKEGYLQTCDTEEIHIGSYGRLEVADGEKQFHPWAIARLLR